MEQKPAFMINTGRCGSTFLSRILNAHPQFIVISELLEPIVNNPYFSHAKVNGSTFWEHLNRKSMQERVDIWRSVKTKELGYLDSIDKNVSLLSAYTLPQLSDSHIELKTKLCNEICTWPEDAISQHFIRFMELIRDTFNKEIWIERTGGSINQVNHILEIWPEANFIFIFRNGFSTLKSMYRHPILSMFSYIESGHPWDVSAPPNPVYISRMWHKWMVKGLSVYSEIPESNKLVINYDRLLEAPEDEASNVLKFCRQDECLHDFDAEWLRWIPSQISVSGENNGNNNENYDDTKLYQEYMKQRRLLSKQFPEMDSML